MKKRVLSLLLAVCMLMSTVAFAEQTPAQVGNRQPLGDTEAHEVSLDSTERIEAVTGKLTLRPGYEDEVPGFTVGAYERPSWVPDVEYVDAGVTNGSAAYSDYTYTVTTEGGTETLPQYTLVQLSDYFKGASQIIVPKQDWNTVANTGYLDWGSSEGWHRRYVFENGYEWYTGSAKTGETYDYTGENVYFKFTPDAAGTLYILSAEGKINNTYVDDGYEHISVMVPKEYDIDEVGDEAAPEGMKYFAVFKEKKNATADVAYTTMGDIYAKRFSADEEVVVHTPHAATVPPVYLIVWDDRDDYENWYDNEPYKVYDLKAANGVVYDNSKSTSWYTSHGYLEKITAKPEWGTFGIIDGICDSGDFINGCRDDSEATLGTLDAASSFLKQSTAILSQGSSRDAIGTYYVNSTKDESIYYVKKTTTDGKKYFTRIKDDGKSFYTADDMTEDSGVMKATTETELELKNGYFTTSVFYPYYNDDEYNLLKASNTNSTKCFDDDYTWYSFKMTSPATVYVGRGGPGKDMTWQRALDQGWSVAEGVTFGNNAKTYCKHYNAGETVKIPTLGYLYDYGVKSAGFDQSDMLIVWDDYRDTDLSALSYKINGGEAVAVPDFDAATTTYTVTLPAGTDLSKVTLEGTAAKSVATVVASAVSAADAVHASATVAVTAKNTADTKTYTVNFVSPIATAINHDSARPRAIRYTVPTAGGSTAWVTIPEYSDATTDNTTEFTIKVPSDATSVQLGITGQPSATTGTGTNSGKKYTYYQQLQTAQWYKSDMTPNQDIGDRKNTDSASYSIGDTAYVAVKSEDGEYTNTYKINIQKRTAAKNYITELNVNSARPTNGIIRVNPDAVDNGVPYYTDRDPNHTWSCLGTEFLGTTQIQTPITDSAGRNGGNATAEQKNAFWGSDKEYFNFKASKGGIVYAINIGGVNTTTNFTKANGWLPITLDTTTPMAWNETNAAVKYSMQRAQWMSETNCAQVTLKNDEDESKEDNVNVWPVWPHRIGETRIGMTSIDYPNGTTSSSYLGRGGYTVFAKAFNANETVSVPVTGVTNQSETLTALIRWDEDYVTTDDTVESIISMGGDVIAETAVRADADKQVSATKFYSDRDNIDVDSASTSDYFIGGTILRRAKEDSGKYAYPYDSTTGTNGELKPYFSTAYDGRNGNPYWLTFRVSDACTVWTTAAYNGEWYNAPDDWRYSQGKLSLRSTDKLYWKHYNAGDVVRIPNYGWCASDDANYGVETWDPQVYAVVWDSSEKVNPADVPQIKLEVSAVSGGTVKVDGVDIGSTLSKAYDENTAHTLEAVAVAGYEFAYWLDENSGRVVSEDATYSVTLATPKKLSAVFANTSESVKSVVFKNKNNQIISKTDVGEGETATVPADPYYMGYVFQGWKLGGVPTALTAGAEIAFADLAEGNNVYIAYYAKNTAKSKLYLTGGTANPADDNNEYEYDTGIKVTAPETSGSKQFSHWIKDGQVVGYENEYTFYMGAADTTVEAKYADTKPTKQPVLIMTNPVVLNGQNRIAFFAERHLYADEGRELIEMGILVDPTGEMVDFGFDTGVLKATSTSKLADGQFTVRKASLTEGQSISARAYMIYREGTTVKTMFSNVVEATYTAE